MSDVFTILLGVLVVVAITVVYFTRRRQPKPVWETTLGGPYIVIITDDLLSCEHPKRAKESIRWNEIDEIALRTTSDGPLMPDMWYLFLGTNAGCSIPSEAKGFDQLWDEIKVRFPKFNYEAVIQAGVDDSYKMIWKKETEQDAAANP